MTVGRLRNLVIDADSSIAGSSPSISSITLGSPASKVTKKYCTQESGYA
jgi:hypothetical protein